MKWTADEVARRAQEIYAERIRAAVEPDRLGDALVLDVESGDYELDADEDRALDRLRARRPRGVLYVLRVGEPASLFIGALSRC